MPSEVAHRTADPDQPQGAEPAFARLASQAEQASGFLKTLAHEGRLMILCALVDGEKSVAELERLGHAKQAAVSQQLARLRAEGVVTARRDGRTIWYSLHDPKAKQMVGLLYQMFCKQG